MSSLSVFIFTTTRKEQRVDNEKSIGWYWFIEIHAAVLAASDRHLIESMETSTKGEVLYLGKLL